MDRYLLDTNAVSHVFKGEEGALVRRSRSVAAERQYIPSIVRAELLFGWYANPRYSSRIEDLQGFLVGFPTLPFDDTAAREYGILRADLKRRGAMIGANDLLIAAVALAHDLVLVTHNVDEFARVSGLRIEDWQSRPA